MPKQKAPKGATSSSEITDPRFSNFATDPRYKLPSKKHARVKVDKRFEGMFKDPKFSNKATVDRYGRKLNKQGNAKKLERLYLKEDASEKGDSDEELETQEEESGAELEPEVEDDEVVQKALKRASRAVPGYDAARGGGFSSSEDDDDDDEEEVEDEDDSFPDMHTEQTEVPMGEVSKRFAVVNLDWDNIKAVDLLHCFQSFVKPGGRVVDVSVYPSEYGKPRIEKEQLEGPTIQRSSKPVEDEDSDHDDEDSDEEDARIKKELIKEDDGELDSTALRKWKIEKMRYYYAVVTCSDNSTAESIYTAVDGREYFGTKNFFDLRFVPDEVTFDDKPDNQCSAIPSGFEPNPVDNDAMAATKIKDSGWDHDPEKKKRAAAIEGAFKGSRTAILENDLQAYLGSDSSESEADDETADPSAPKLTKKQLERQKKRALLGLTDEPAPKQVKGPVGDMEITFTAGLTPSTSGVFVNKPIVEETTAEAYKRKEKERKARRKEKARAIREGRDPEASPEPEKEVDEADLGFDDPFFAADEGVKDKARKDKRKAERKAKREVKDAEEAEKTKSKKELELLMQDNLAESGPRLDHVDIKEIARAEKQSKKKGRRSKLKDGEEFESKRGGLQKSFQMDVGDDRFAGMFEDHALALDPSNPKFLKTEGMNLLLQEGRRKRKAGEDVGERETKRKSGQGGSTKGDLGSLVESVKKKLKGN